VPDRKANIPERPCERGELTLWSRGLFEDGFLRAGPLGVGEAEDPAWIASSLFGVRNDVSYAGAEATFGHLAL